MKAIGSWLAAGGGGGEDDFGSFGVVGSATATNRLPRGRATPCLLHSPSATVSAKLFRASRVALLSQSVPVRQPFTFGGLNRTCPILASGSTMSESGTRPGV